MVGGDGTVYAHLDVAARQTSYNRRTAPASVQPLRPATVPEPSIYAFIDHIIKLDDLARSNKNDKYFAKHRNIKSALVFVLLLTAIF